MNLHSIAASNIAPVNPKLFVTLQINTGYTTSADGTRTPNYIYQSNILAQIQPLTFNEIRQVDGLNIQGEKRAFYLNGRVEGINRAQGTGGDLIVFPTGLRWPYGTTWLIVLVVESWPEWCKVVGTLQNQISY